MRSDIIAHRVRRPHGGLDTSDLVAVADDMSADITVHKGHGLRVSGLHAGSQHHAFGGDRVLRAVGIQIVDAILTFAFSS